MSNTVIASMLGFLIAFSVLTSYNRNKELIGLVRANERLTIELATVERHRVACIDELGDGIINWEDVEEEE